MNEAHDAPREIFQGSTPWFAERTQR
jgi:hypothetical protein